MRVAANIAGFYLYPVGWSWTEAPVEDPAAHMPFRTKAEEVGRLGIALDGRQTGDGLRAFRRGAAHRRQVVEAVLLDLIRRTSIPAYLSDRNGDTHDIGDTTRLFHDLRLDVRTSCIGLHDMVHAPAWTCETDAEKLVLALSDRQAWKTNSSGNDWLLIERYAREIIEQNGLPATRAQLAKDVTEWASARWDEPVEPARTETLALMSRLFDEYGESEISGDE